MIDDQNLRRTKKDQKRRKKLRSVRTPSLLLVWRRVRRLCTGATVSSRGADTFCVVTGDCEGGSRQRKLRATTVPYVTYPPTGTSPLSYLLDHLATLYIYLAYLDLNLSLERQSCLTTVPTPWAITSKTHLTPPALYSDFPTSS